MRSEREVKWVLDLVATGRSDANIARITGIPRSTVREWRIGRWSGRNGGRRRRPCPICLPGSLDLPADEYVYLLGLYLGDGCISRGPRTYCLRFFLDPTYPGIVASCRAAVEHLRPFQHAWVKRSESSRCFVVAMWSNHWPCYFPQHGPGKKHERPIVLADWQEEILAEHHREFVRGLIHSDGCRIVANDRGVKSVRYHFSNMSDDIKALYCGSLDALGVRWTRPCAQQIAVYRKSSVAILEGFIGPKR